MKKRLSQPSWYERILFVLFVCFVLVPLGLILLPYLLFQLCCQHIPIWKVMAKQPAYWLTWKEVKQQTGAKTNHVLGALQSGVHAELLECRLRDQVYLKRLERHMGMRPPRASIPVTIHHVVYFEYRYIRRGGRTFNWFALLPVQLRRSLRANA